MTPSLPATGITRHQSNSNLINGFYQVLKHDIKGIVSRDT
jgi:hypothetical protein